MNTDILALIIAIIGAIVSMNAVPPKWQYIFGVGVGIIVGVIGGRG